MDDKEHMQRSVAAALKRKLAQATADKVRVSADRAAHLMEQALTDWMAEHIESDVQVEAEPSNDDADKSARILPKVNVTVTRKYKP